MVTTVKGCCPPHRYIIPRGEKTGTCPYCGKQKEFLGWEDVTSRIKPYPYGGSCKATTSHPPLPAPTTDKGLQPLSAVLPDTMVSQGHARENKSPGENEGDKTKSVSHY